jgi:predicted RNase H-like nuclease (RuvC/YqgF family)
MVRGKIVDHQITGKQKFAVVRDHNRSLDSLTSPSDKRTQHSIDSFVGEWPSIKDSKEGHYLLQRNKKTKHVLTVAQKELESLQKNLIHFMREYERVCSKMISHGAKYHALNKLDKKITYTKTRIQEVEKRMKNDRLI